jgi:hypothetical protein
VNDQIVEFYKKLMKYHIDEKQSCQDECAFLWTRLVVLIEVVLNNNFGDGSGETAMRHEADAALKDLIERIS